MTSFSRKDSQYMLYHNIPIAQISYKIPIQHHRFNYSNYWHISDDLLKTDRKPLSSSADMYSDMASVCRIDWLLIADSTRTDSSSDELSSAAVTADLVLTGDTAPFGFEWSVTVCTCDSSFITDEDLIDRSLAVCTSLESGPTLSNNQQ